MDDKERIFTYSIGIIMIALLDEYNKSERIGAIARIFNALAKKHNQFFEQTVKLSVGKRKKLSDKCLLFLEAKRNAEIAWQKTIENDTVRQAITVNTMVTLLHFKHKEALKYIYGVSAEDFALLNSSTKYKDTTMPSIRTANALLQYLEEAFNIANKEGTHGAA